ncbi:MAG: PilZ domain-containing protein [Pseudomonadota bacterium]
MDDRSQLKGDRINQLLEELKTTNTLVTLRLRGVEGYERLTMITDIRTDPGGTFLVLDPPRGFQSAVAKAPRWRLQFTFTGQDKLEYNFNTSGGRIEADGIWVPVPEAISRIQRRRHFRVDTPPGTLLALTINGEARAMDLINISQSGGLGIVSRMRRNEQTSEPIFKIGAQLANLVIACPGSPEAEATKASIKKAVVRRVEQDTAQYRHRYALEFLELTPADQRIITAFILRVQREFLRKR